jgi:hypothetical protein
MKHLTLPQEGLRWRWWMERSASARRLVLFVGGLCAALGGLEWAAQANNELLEALSDRGRIKIAMFAQHSRDQFLFLGSSRMEGAVSPILITRAVGSIAPELGDVHGFNAAYAGANLDALSALIPRIGFTNNLRLVVIEASAAQLAISPAPQEKLQSSVATIEDRLVTVAQHIYIVKHRKAYGYLGYLPAILIFGPRLGGWETKAKDQIASFRGREEEAAVGFEEQLWTPELFLPSTDPQLLDEQSEKIVARLVTIAQEVQRRGVSVVFVVPPLRGDLVALENNVLRPLFAEIARRTHCEVWNFSSQSLPEVFFRDTSHLGDIGRAHFSRALAGPIVRTLKAK